jgi:hypothetical protein
LGGGGSVKAFGPAGRLHFLGHRQPDAGPRWGRCMQLVP